MTDILNHIKELLYQARHTVHLGDFEIARQQYSVALSEARRTSYKNAEGAALLELARIAMRTDKNMANARKLLESSLRVFTEINGAIGRAYVLVQLSRLSLGKGNTEEAMSRLSEAMNIFRRKRNQHGIATVLLEMWMVERLVGDFVSAEQHVQESLLISEELGNKSAIGQTLLSVGASSIECHHDIQQARMHFNRALAIFEELGYTYDAERTRENLRAIEHLEA